MYFRTTGFGDVCLSGIVAHDREKEKNVLIEKKSKPTVPEF